MSEDKVIEALKPCPWCDGGVRDSGDGTVFHAGEHHCPIGGHFDKSRWNRRTTAETVSREATPEDYRTWYSMTDGAAEYRFARKCGETNKAGMERACGFWGGFESAKKAIRLPAPQPVSTGDWSSLIDEMHLALIEALGKGGNGGASWQECFDRGQDLLARIASRPPVPSVPECWELLAKVHTIATMNDGGLPGETMREMKAALEAYPEYRQDATDPRDVVLPWAELMDLIAYFNTVGDKRAEAMLRGLKFVPSVVGVPSALVCAEILFDLDFPGRNLSREGVFTKEHYEGRGEKLHADLLTRQQGGKP